MGRFFTGYPWRFIVTDLASAPVTWLDRIASDREVGMALGQSTVIQGKVRSDDPRVNTLHTDGVPYVAPNRRLVYGFRREGASPLWRCRAAGLLHNVEDNADPASSFTTYTAWDGRKYLEGRPYMNADGVFPGVQGFNLFAQAGSKIIGDALAYAIADDVREGRPASTCRVDAGVAYGGTAFYGSSGAVIEATMPINFDVQQGMSVAAVWAEAEATGLCDIVLFPIWDPVNRPGYTHELGVYNLAGAVRPEAIFSWDMLNRAASGANRMHDGTPGNFVNRVQFYVGQGGLPVPLQTNALSLAAHGPYWAQQFFPEQLLGETVVQFARQALTLAKQGLRTTTLTPTPERSPIPLLDYANGDRVPYYASPSLRVAAAGFQRVQAIPFQISDDGIESVPALLMSPDWRTGPT